jgi:large subunit ribosomal protein L6
VSGNKVNLSLGFSHPIEFELPDGVTAKMDGQTTIVLASADKHAVGEIAARIRRLRPPEPYKGKGIRYEGEEVRRKAGKAAATAAG